MGPGFDREGNNLVVGLAETDAFDSHLHGLQSLRAAVRALQPAPAKSAIPCITAAMQTDCGHRPASGLALYLTITFEYE